MTEPQLTILIGSFARGTALSYSDIDIVRVGHRRALTKAQVRSIANSTAPISYIDYELEVFTSLHQSGSLFVHHILTEGKLIAGSACLWSDLAERFSVTKDLSNEFREQVALCAWIARPTLFSDAAIPFLSHMFKALKNAAIFSLAHRGVYVYDKSQALKTAFTFLTNDDIDLLISANCTYERGTPLFTPLTTLEKTNVLPDLCSRVASAVGEMVQNGS